jgi:outer membrane protein
MMMTKIGKSWIRNLALAGSVAMAGLVPAKAMADNLSDALIGAYKSSGLLEQNRALLRAADEDVAIALSALRPVINWTIRFQTEYAHSNTNGLVTDTDQTSLFAGLTLQQLLWDNGGTKLAKQAQQETVLATRQTLLSIEQQVLLRAVAAYSSVLLQQENVALRRNNLRLLREELRAAQDRFEVGEVTRTDVALAQSRVAAAQAELTDAQGALIDAKSEYANAVGHDPGVIARQPTLPRRVASVEKARSVAMQNHPDILSDQHTVKAAELRVQSTARTLGPSVNLVGNLGYTERYSGTDTDIDNASIAIEMTQPLYAGGRLAANFRKSMAQRDATKAALITTQRDTAQGVNNAFVALEVARANLQSSYERIRAARVAFDGVREEATLGARTTLDVLQAEQELLNAETAQIQARAEEVVAAYQLVAAQGLLTAERLGLAVEIYDPTLYYNLVKDAPANYSHRSHQLNRVLKALGKN